MIDRVNRAFAARQLMIDVTIAEGSLTTSGSGTAQSISLGTPPPGAVLLGYAINPIENFAGGSISAVDLEVGPTADKDAIVDAVSLEDATEGVWTQGTAGVSPKGPGYGGVELFGTFTPTGDSVLNLTAGSVRIQLYFALPELLA